jgi:hypothetical protein
MEEAANAIEVFINARADDLEAYQNSLASFHIQAPFLEGLHELSNNITFQLLKYLALNTSWANVHCS